MLCQRYCENDDEPQLKDDVSSRGDLIRVISLPEQNCDPAMLDFIFAISKYHGYHLLGVLGRSSVDGILSPRRLEHGNHKLYHQSVYV